MIHHFTVDVEEFFHSSVVERWVPRDRWNAEPLRARRVTERLLELLDEKGVSGTFFVLGWLAEREPTLVPEIAGAGHEIASHGWSHRLTTALDPEGFREEVRRSRGSLEDQSGRRVTGFRAPSFSIVPGIEWAFDVLLEEGYRYDSSLFPVGVHPTYGYPCPRGPHLVTRPGGILAELPPATLRLLGTNLPVGGGAYFRFLPYRLLRQGLAGAERRGESGTFYIHPWELDPGVGRSGLPLLQYLRTRGRSGDLWKRLSRMLEEFRFRRMEETVSELLGSSSGDARPSTAAPEAS